LGPYLQILDKLGRSKLSNLLCRGVSDEEKNKITLKPGMPSSFLRRCTHRPPGANCY